MRTALWFRISSILMGVLFLVSVALQYNDPDPIEWMAIYGAAAGAAFSSPWLRWGRRLAFGVLLVSLVWFGWLLFGVWGQIGFSDLFLKMSEKGGQVEIGREAGGLAIVSVWMLVCGLVRPEQAS